MTPPVSGFLLPLPLKQSPQAKKNFNTIEVTAAGVRTGFAHSWLEARGFFHDNSIARRDLFEDPKPLLTWPFLDFLATLDLSKTQLVELGSGNSTLAFAKCFRTVRTFENDASWAASLEPKLPQNVVLTRFNGTVLDPALVRTKPHEWLLVDFAGKRTRFIRALVTSLKQPALPPVVVLDNSDWYRTGAGLLVGAGYTEIPFFGLKSGQTWVSCTSFFFRPERLRLTTLAPFRQPPFSRPRAGGWDSLK